MDGFSLSIIRAMQGMPSRVRVEAVWRGKCLDLGKWWIVITLGMLLGGNALLGAANFVEFPYRSAAEREIAEPPASLAEVLEDGPEVVVPETFAGKPVTELKGFDFSRCRSAKSIKIPKTVQAVSPSIFWECTNLVAITVDPENPHFVSHDGVLYNRDQTVLVRCPPGWSGHFTVPRGVVEICGGAFASSGLTGISLGSEVVRLGGHAFAYCGRLRVVELPEKVRFLENGTFMACSNLSQITLPRGLTNFMYCVFWRCHALREVVIPEGVQVIPMAAFAHCGSLTNIVLPAGLREIGGNAFSDCTNLLAITIPGQVETIGAAAFAHCENLERVVVGAKVNMIRDLAFARNPRLKAVYFHGNAPSVGTNDIFKSSGQAAVFYRPSATGWDPFLGSRPTAVWPAGADSDRRP